MATLPQACDHTLSPASGLGSGTPPDTAETLCHDLLDLPGCQTLVVAKLDHAEDSPRLVPWISLPECVPEPRNQNPGWPAAQCPLLMELSGSSRDSFRCSRRTNSLGVAVKTCLPLVGSDGQVEGVVTIGGNGQAALDEQELKLVRAVAALLAALLDRDRLLAESSARIEAQHTELETARNELESISYSVSHDLRGPLGAITGLAQVVLDEYAEALAGSGQECLEQIIKSGEKLNRIIDDLQDLSRVSRQPMEPLEIDLSNMVETLVSELHHAAPHREIEVRIDPGLRCTGDERMLNLALMNLLENAWKFTAKREHPFIHFGSILRDGRIAFFVKDNGAGFDMARAAKLFKPFCRLHSEAELAGSGVGLAVVDRIVKRHGGSVWAEGETGKGATFYFTLQRP